MLRSIGPQAGQNWQNSAWKSPPQSLPQVQEPESRGQEPESSTPAAGRQGQEPESSTPAAGWQEQVRHRTQSVLGQAESRAPPAVRAAVLGQAQSVQEAS